MYEYVFRRTLNLSQVPSAEKGREIQNSHNFADFIYGWSLELAVLQLFLVSRIDGDFPGSDRVPGKGIFPFRVVLFSRKPAAWGLNSAGEAICQRAFLFSLPKGIPEKALVEVRW